MENQEIKNDLEIEETSLPANEAESQEEATSLAENDAPLKSETSLVNGDLSISYPYDYVEMEQVDSGRLRFTGLNLQNKKQHIIISILCLSSDSMLFSMGRAKSMLKQIESSVSGSNDYERFEDLSMIIGQKEAVGFHYKFTINEITQHAEVFAVKSKKDIYSITIYARDPEKFSQDVVLDVLKSIKFLSNDEPEKKSRRRK